jgi:NADPH:quinone reductase-like Zn-dependent oxidoreductase
LNEWREMPKTYVFTEFGGEDKQMFLDLPKPGPGEGQLLVRVHAAGVNPRDWKKRAGLYRVGDDSTGPTPMGSEVSGIVEEIGNNVHGFTIGDAVFGRVEANGAFSEYSLLRATETAHKPKELSFIDAATLPVAAATAYAGIEELELSLGEVLLIIGAGGGVGIPAAQFAIAKGAHVIGTASAAKQTLVESIGVTHVTSGSGALDRVREVAPRGVDAIFDMVGGDAMRDLGNLVTSGRIRAVANQTAAAEFGGTRVGRIRGTTILDAIANMIVAGTFKPIVTQVFPLEQAGDALALLEGGHATGKVVIEV